MTGTVLRVLSTPAARIVMTIVLLASILLYVLSYTPAPKTGSWDFTPTAWAEASDGMVFPMSARGKLIGALACRTKRDTTAFAPDEREPLFEVARATARALLALGSSTSPSADSLTQAILTMQAMMLEIRDTLVTPTLTDGEIRA